MRDLFSGLVALHDLAAPYGGGLKPELLAIVERERGIESQGAVLLPVKPISSGPEHQYATSEQLRRAGIPTLRANKERPDVKRA